MKGVGKSKRSPLKGGTLTKQTSKQNNKQASTQARKHASKQASRQAGKQTETNEQSEKLKATKPNQTKPHKEASPEAPGGICAQAFDDSEICTTRVAPHGLCRVTKVVIVPRALGALATRSSDFAFGRGCQNRVTPKWDPGNRKVE